MNGEASRPTFCVFIAVSVDGYIARPDGGLDWLEAVADPGQDYGYQEFASSIDTIVFGRNTYDVALSFEPWPYEGKRCVVLTRRPAESKHGETFFRGAPLELAEELGARGAKRVYVDGGATIRAFFAAGLVDELTLSVVPVVLGGGIPLFGPCLPESRLVFRESRTFSRGLIQLRYTVPAP